MHKISPASIKRGVRAAHHCDTRTLGIKNMIVDYRESLLFQVILRGSLVEAAVALLDYSRAVG